MSYADAEHMEAGRMQIPAADETEMGAEAACWQSRRRVTGREA